MPILRTFFCAFALWASARNLVPASVFSFCRVGCQPEHHTLAGGETKMKLHILVRKGVLGFALAGLVVGSAIAQAQNKDAAKAQKDAANDTCVKHVKRNTKPANKTHKPKICPLCVPHLPNKWGDLDKSHLLNDKRIAPVSPQAGKVRFSTSPH
jgi:hypothetical protein